MLACLCVFALFHVFFSVCLIISFRSCWCSNSNSSWMLVIYFCCASFFTWLLKQPNTLKDTKNSSLYCRWENSIGFVRGLLNYIHNLCFPKVYENISIICNTNSFPIWEILFSIHTENKLCLLHPRIYFSYYARRSGENSSVYVCIRTKYINMTFPVVLIWTTVKWNEAFVIFWHRTTNSQQW